jgi:hypothetical protein
MGMPTCLGVSISSPVVEQQMITEQERKVCVWNYLPRVEA